MEDLEKYLFDPKNPKGFKSYKLLAEIIRKGENIAFVDPYFLIEIFEKEIFNQEVINKLWDKPDNFNQLTSHQKVDIYIANYSIAELIEIFADRYSAIKSHYLNSLFTRFICFHPLLDDLKVSWENRKFYNSKLHCKCTKQSLLFLETPVLTDNLVIFVGEAGSRLVDIFKPLRSSIFITTQESLSYYF